MWILKLTGETGTWTQQHVTVLNLKQRRTVLYSKIWVQLETPNEMGADAFQADILSILATQVALLTVFFSLESVDYQQTLFFLSPSSEMHETRKYSWK